jgi:hypothetical protein
LNKVAYFPVDLELTETSVSWDDWEYASSSTDDSSYVYSDREDVSTTDGDSVETDSKVDDDEDE